MIAWKYRLALLLWAIAIQTIIVGLTVDAIDLPPMVSSALGFAGVLLGYLAGREMRR